MWLSIETFNKSYHNVSKSIRDILYVYLLINFLVAIYYFIIIFKKPKHRIMKYLNIIE